MVPRQAPGALRARPRLRVRLRFVTILSWSGWNGPGTVGFGGKRDAERALYDGVIRTRRGWAGTAFARSNPVGATRKSLRPSWFPRLAGARRPNLTFFSHNSLTPSADQPLIRLGRRSAAPVDGHAPRLGDPDADVAEPLATIPARRPQSELT